MLAARVQEELDLREVRQHHARVGSKHARELTPSTHDSLCSQTNRSSRPPPVHRSTDWTAGKPWMASRIHVFNDGGASMECLQRLRPSMNRTPA